MFTALVRALPRMAAGGHTGHDPTLASSPGRQEWGLIRTVSGVHRSRTPWSRRSSAWPERIREGDQRIQGERLTLGHRVGASTIHGVLQRLPIPPAPPPRHRHDLATVPVRPASTMLAGDFF